MSARQFSDQAQPTTLDGSISDSDTTITVASKVGWPASYPYTILIDPDTAAEEIVEVTNASGLDLTCTRGVVGPSAQAHNTGAVVRHGFSGRDLQLPHDHAAATSGIHGITGDLASQLVRVFANEAARDAAITSPTEGMVALITSSTVAAATGAKTGVPSVIETRYDGTQWVCVTPISATTQANGTTTSTGFTATLSGTPGTNPSVTLVTGTKVRIRISFLGQSNTTSGVCMMGVAVSGASAIGASSDCRAWATSAVANNYNSSAVVTTLDGLTAGTNTFTLVYMVLSGTGTFQERNIAVEAIA